MHEQIVKPFVVQLVQAAAGEKIHFFKSVQLNGYEMKIYFTSTKLITAKFHNRNLVEFQFRIRPPRESLLGVEGALIEQLRVHKLAS